MKNGTVKRGWKI